MIVSFNGDEGSGKSTIAKLVAAEISYPRYYMGQIFRDMAAKRNMTLVDYVKLGETDPAIDKEIDDYLVDLSKKEADFIIESRTAWHFIPESLKIYLSVDEKEGAKRVFKELQKENQRNEISGDFSLEDILNKIKERRATDDARYMKYYNIDIRDKNNYDLVLDTTSLSKKEVFDKVMNFINSRNNR
ncbi:MAG: cytidylate kinase family protein [Parcubacteria group bacterium]